MQIVQIRILIVTTTLIFACSTRAFAVNYILTDLGTPNGVSSTPYSINSSGEVAGLLNSSSFGLHAFLYSGGTLNDFGPLVGLNSFATGINDSGEVVGYQYSGTPQAYIYDKGTVAFIGTLGGDRSLAFGVNNAGQITGWSETAASQPRAFLYTNGVMQNLGTLGAGSYGTAVNDIGDVVGYSAPLGAGQHAFIYTAGAMNDLGTLGGTNSRALSINHSGQVVGYSDLANSMNQHAFLYSNGMMIDLETLTSTTLYSSEALGINDAGQVVGWSTGPFLPGGGYDYHAIIYDNGKMLDLNSLVSPSLGWDLNEATAINNVGQIAGWGTINGQTHAFILTPVPEPPAATLLLAAMTIAGLLWRHRS